MPERRDAVPKWVRALDERKQAYSDVARLLNETYAYVPLYNRLLINAFSTDVNGWVPNPWEEVTWDAVNWIHE